MFDAPAAPDHFPYTFAEEATLPAHHRLRFEGRPFSDSARQARGYLKKYLRPRWSACPEEVAYFDRQRHLVRWLSRRPANGTRLAAVGDIMWLRDSWDDFLTADVLAHLNKHDLVVGNLETPISPRHYVHRVLPDVVHFNSKPGLLTLFARPDGRNTFAAVATANNHCLDKGDDGLTDTLAFLDSRRVAHSGARRPGETPWVMLEANGFKVGFYSACWGLNDPALIHKTGFRIETIPGLVPTVCHPVDLGRLREVLADMTAAGADFKIIALHWGHEYEFYPSPDVMRVGRDIIRLGADLIVGSHPHVVQPLEVCFVNGYESRLRSDGYDSPALDTRSGCVLTDGTGVPRKGLIAYSLGNFVTAMYTPHCRTGLVLGLHLTRTPDGRTDWHRPEATWVYNARLNPLPGRRRLMLLERFLRTWPPRGRRGRAIAEMGTWLDRHLHGEPGA